MPTPTKSCTYERLATGVIASVDWCKSCDTVAVHVGAVTLRMDSGSLMSLWAILEDALTALDASTSGRPVPAWVPGTTRGSA